MEKNDAASGAPIELSEHAHEILGIMRANHRKPGARMLIAEIVSRLGATPPAIAAAASELVAAGYIAAPDGDTIELTARGYDAVQGADAGAHQPPLAPELPLDPVEEASRDSFPASDAPAWTGSTIG